MITKKERVKITVLQWEHRVLWVNYLHRMITGSDGIVQWHNPLFEVSKSTVRRALDELEREGHMESYYIYGHCYDTKMYKKIK